MNNVIRAVDSYPYAVRKKRGQRSSTTAAVDNQNQQEEKMASKEQPSRSHRAIQEHKHDVHTYTTSAHSTTLSTPTGRSRQHTASTQASQNKQASEYHEILSRSKHLLVPVPVLLPVQEKMRRI